MPALRPPGVTMTLPPSMSGDSLMSHGILRPPKSRRMLRCQTHGRRPARGARPGRRSRSGRTGGRRPPSVSRAVRARDRCPGRPDRAGPDAPSRRARFRLVTMLSRFRSPCTNTRAAADGHRSVAGPEVRWPTTTAGGPDAGHWAAGRFPARCRCGPGRATAASRGLGRPARRAERQQQHGARQASRRYRDRRMKSLLNSWSSVSIPPDSSCRRPHETQPVSSSPASS